MSWVGWVLIFAGVLAMACMGAMLVYRHGHKTTIEMDLLIKQMRITGKLRILSIHQKERIDLLEDFHRVLADQWKAQRAEVQSRHRYDIGELPEMPRPDVNLTNLIDNVDSDVGRVGV